MRIDRRLNLVIPIYQGEGDPVAWVHSTPLSREVFESNFLLVSKTFAAIHAEGLGEIAGPRVAKLVMGRIASGMMGGLESATALMNEIRRLSNVLAIVGGGWQTVPLQNAQEAGLLDEDDVPEVENALCFFTVLSGMHRREVLAEILPGAARLWGALTSSLGCTEYLDSLRTSTRAGSSGATLPPGLLTQGSEGPQASSHPS